MAIMSALEMAPILAYMVNCLGPANVYQHKTQRVHREFVAWLLSLVERLWKNVENCDRENGAGVALSATTMSHRRILISGPNFVGFTNFTSKVAPSKV